MGSSDSNPEFLTVSAASARLGIPRWKLWRAIKKKLIPSYRFFNGRLLVRLSEVINAIEKDTAA
jgi:excisionase family DNA binding protein